MFSALVYMCVCSRYFRGEIACVRAHLYAPARACVCIDVKEKHSSSQKQTVPVECRFKVAFDVLLVGLFIWQWTDWSVQEENGPRYVVSCPRVDTEGSSCVISLTTLLMYDAHCDKDLQRKGSVFYTTSFVFLFSLKHVVVNSDSLHSARAIVAFILQRIKDICHTPRILLRYSCVHVYRR